MPVRQISEDVDPALAHAIEETILFGKREEMEILLEQLADETRLSDTLRHDIESLIFFRNHYNTLPDLADAVRQKIVRIDADWAMQLIQRLHNRTFGVVEKRLA